MFRSSIFTCCLLSIAFISAKRTYSIRSHHVQPDYPECRIDPTKGETCPFNKMETTTMVYPGGKSHCAYDTNRWWGLDGTYRFRVIPGVGKTRNNVVLYFTGGGSCFGFVTCAATTLKFIQLITKGAGSHFHEVAIAEFETGIFNRTRLDNTFHGWTIVELPSCTGDSHLGTKKYTDIFKNFYHYGAYNVEEVLKWVYAQLHPTQLVITGGSGGALATQAWAHRIITDYKQRANPPKISVIADSYVAVVEPRRHAELIKRWGVCDANLNLSDELKKKCHEGKLTFQDIVKFTLTEHPEVPFGMIHSNRDAVEKTFYCILEGKFFNVYKCISDQVFKTKVTTIFEDYITTLKHHGTSNLAFYIVDNNIHNYTPKPDFFQVAVQAPTSPNMNQWVGQVVRNNHVDTCCDGCSEQVKQCSIQLPVI